MVAPVLSVRLKPIETRDRREGRSGPVCQWWIVQHCNTVEAAERAVDSLRRRGIDARLSLIDGLSVLARRPDCAADRD